MNNQQTTDKAGSPRRLKIMKSDQTLYGILAGSEEKGRGAMETAVYVTCILSVVAAIFQFIGQPTPDPFAGFDSTAQPAPVVSHTCKQRGIQNPETRRGRRYVAITEGRRAAPSAESFRRSVASLQRFATSISQRTISAGF